MWAVCCGLTLSGSEDSFAARDLASNALRTHDRSAGRPAGRLWSLSPQFCLQTYKIWMRTARSRNPFAEKKWLSLRPEISLPHSQNFATGHSCKSDDFHPQKFHKFLSIFFFRQVCKIVKSDFELRRFCPSFRIEQVDTHWTDYCEIYCIIYIIL